MYSCKSYTRQSFYTNKLSISTVLETCRQHQFIFILLYNQGVLFKKTWTFAIKTDSLEVSSDSSAPTEQNSTVPKDVKTLGSKT